MDNSLGPIYQKSGNIQEVGNYRCSSVDYIDGNHKLNDVESRIHIHRSSSTSKQNGFRKGRSTTSYVISLIHYLSAMGSH